MGSGLQETVDDTAIRIAREVRAEVKATKGWVSELANRIVTLENSGKALAATQIDNQRSIDERIGGLARDISGIRSEAHVVNAKIGKLETGIEELLEAKRSEQGGLVDRLIASQIQKEEAEAAKAKREKEERDEKRKDRRATWQFALVLIGTISAAAGGIIAATKGNPPSVVVPQAVPVPLPVPTAHAETRPLAPP